MTQRLLIARIGWMEYYNGPQQDDPRPIGGGSYTKTKLGNELYNFKRLKGRVYGFAEPPNKLNIALQRIEPDAKEESLRDVLVVFIAKSSEGGQRVIGWYKDATVYRLRQKPHPATPADFCYLFTTESQNAILVPTPYRTCTVPRGIGAPGQKNIFYPFEANGARKHLPWLDKVLGFIEKYKVLSPEEHAEAEEVPQSVARLNEALEDAAGFETNARTRKAIELCAMKKAMKAYSDLGYKVEDISSTGPLDLHCARKNGSTDADHYVEVKGTRGLGNVVALTANEVRYLQEHSGNASLCVVHSIVLTDEDKASKGILRIIKGDDLNRGILKPVEFFYTLPK